MGFKRIEVQSVSYDGEDVVLEHQDLVSATIWNRFVENSASRYNRPDTVLNIATDDLIIGSTGSFDEAWGVVPPSNRACDSTYGELFLVWLDLAWTFHSGSGDGTIKVYGGTDRSAMTLLHTSTLLNGFDGSFNGRIVVDEDSSIYTNIHGTATPYYISVIGTRSNSTTNFILSSLDIYYRKYLDTTGVYDYEGNLLSEFTTATGRFGSTNGFTGTGGVISDTFNQSNLGSIALSSGTYPSTVEFSHFRWDGIGGTYGDITSGFTGDSSAYSLDYTRVISNLRFYNNRLDGNLTTVWKNVFSDTASGDHNLKMKLWNDSGTTYANISGGALEVGATGVNVTLGAFDQNGWFPITYSGLTYEEDGRVSLTVSFTMSAFSLPTVTQKVYIDSSIQDSITLSVVGAMRYETTNISTMSPFGIIKHSCEWTL